MMKLVLVSMLLIATQAFAFNERSSWDEIFATHNTIIRFSEDLGGLPLNNACLTATQVRSIRDVQKCNKLVEVKKGENKDRYSDWVCYSWVWQQVRYPRTTLKDDKRVTVPQTIRAHVGRGSGEIMMGPSFRKDFTFPNCGS